jgi:hypothetical protein
MVAYFAALLHGARDDDSILPSQPTTEQLQFLAEVLFEGLKLEHLSIPPDQRKAALLWKVWGSWMWASEPWD